MNRIIEQLSKIENQTSAILNSAADKQKALASEYEEKTRQFDENLNTETDQEVDRLRSDMEEAILEQIHAQEAAAKKDTDRLVRHYDAFHSQYADRLFQDMTEV